MDFIEVHFQKSEFAHSLALPPTPYSVRNASGHG